ncbi:MAG: nuclear transport factor 2 family protein [Chloroflexota bacterium]
MITNESVSLWLANYVEAWKSYDPDAIGALFSEDAHYYYSPYSEPLEGRETIVASWLENRDKVGTYTAEYRVIATNGNLVVTNGRSSYFEDDGKTLVREYDNVFVIEFDDTGKCSLFKEWYMKNPNNKA